VIGGLIIQGRSYKGAARMKAPQKKITPKKKPPKRKAGPNLGAAINLRLKIQPFVEPVSSNEFASLKIIPNGNGEKRIIKSGFYLPSDDKDTRDAIAREFRYRLEYIRTHLEQVLLEDIHCLFDEAGFSGAPREVIRESMGAQAYAIMSHQTVRAKTTPEKPGGILEFLTMMRIQHMHARLGGSIIRMFDSKPKRIFSPFRVIIYQAFYANELKRWQKIRRAYKQAIEYDGDWRYEIEARHKIEQYEKDLLECVPTHEANEIAIVCAARHAGARVDISDISAIKRAVREERKRLREYQQTGRAWEDAESAARSISARKS
jgi:hypothetical protein